MTLTEANAIRENTKTSKASPVQYLSSKQESLTWEQGRELTLQHFVALTAQVQGLGKLLQKGMDITTEVQLRYMIGRLASQGVAAGVAASKADFFRAVDLKSEDSDAYRAVIEALGKEEEAA